MGDNDKLIGKRIKEMREQLHIKQVELAEGADISTSFLYHVESGSRRPSLSTLLRIVDALGITVDELLCGNQKNDPCTYQTDMDLLLVDCSPREKRLIFHTMRALKESLRETESRPAGPSPAPADSWKKCE